MAIKALTSHVTVDMDDDVEKYLAACDGKEGLDDLRDTFEKLGELFGVMIVSGAKKSGATKLSELLGKSIRIEMTIEAHDVTKDNAAEILLRAFEQFAASKSCDKCGKCKDGDD